MDFLTTWWKGGIWAKTEPNTLWNRSGQRWSCRNFFFHPFFKIEAWLNLRELFVFLLYWVLLFRYLVIYQCTEETNIFLLWNIRDLSNKYKSQSWWQWVSVQNSMAIITWIFQSTPLYMTFFIFWCDSILVCSIARNKKSEAILPLTFSYPDALGLLLNNWRFKCLFSWRKSWSSFSWDEKRKQTLAPKMSPWLDKSTAIKPSI